MTETVASREAFIEDALQVMQEATQDKKSSGLYVMTLAHQLVKRGYNEFTSINNIWMVLDKGFLGFTDEGFLTLVVNSASLNNNFTADDVLV